MKSPCNFRQSSDRTLYISKTITLLQRILKALEWHKMQVSSSHQLRNNYQENVHDSIQNKKSLKELSGYDICVFMFNLKQGL